MIHYIFRLFISVWCIFGIESYLCAPVEPTIKPKNSQEPVPSGVHTEPTHEQEIGETHNPVEPSNTTSIKEPSSYSTHNIDLSADTNAPEQDSFTHMVIEKGEESDVDKNQEALQEHEQEKELESKEKLESMNQEEEQFLEGIMQNDAQALQQNSANSVEILEKIAQKMGLSSKPQSTQDITMQNIIIEWNNLASHYKNSTIPDQALKSFFKNMNDTIKKS